MVKAATRRMANGIREVRTAGTRTRMRRRAGTTIQDPTVMEAVATPAQQAVLLPQRRLHDRIILPTNITTGHGDA